MFSRKNIGGCGYTMLVCIVACVLFIFNLAVCSAGYESMRATKLEILADPKFRQGILLSAPVLLIFVEFLIYDFMIDIFLPVAKRAKKQSD